jgi:hypothetical protein
VNENQVPDNVLTIFAATQDHDESRDKEEYDKEEDVKI